MMYRQHAAILRQPCLLGQFGRLVWRVPNLRTDQTDLGEHDALCQYIIDSDSDGINRNFMTVGLLTAGWVVVCCSML